MTRWADSERHRPRLGAQDGMTFMEVIVAALVLTLGALAVLSLVGATVRNNYRAEQSQVVSNRLQDELEKFKQLADDANFDRIATTSAPSHSTDPNDPAWRVSGTNYAVNRNGTGLEPMVIDGGGFAPVTHFSSGDVQATIHRFVVWEPSSACPPPSDPCLKRVIVSIQLDATGVAGVRRYQEIQALIADPRARENDTAAPPGGDATPWSFWLTDSTCDNSDRQALAGDHLTHNTRGVCATGLKNANDCTSVGGVVTSCPAGAPDLMVTHPPPVFSEEPLINFATDVLSPDPALDKGLRTLKPATSGCPPLDLPSVSDTTNPARYQEIHKWLSPAIPNGFDVQLNGRGALSLWTRTVAGVSYPARICVWLFQRQLNAGQWVDTPAANLDLSGNPFYFQYSANPWPSDKWSEVTVPLHFTLSAQLVAGSRLGVAVQVERAGTTGGGLQFLYDEPSFESRLEVKTTTVDLPF